jgi:hypothetical protein
MPLPFLQSYNDPKIEKAYRRYLAGESQRQILGKVKGLSQRTLARYCKNDGWEAERQARAVTEEAPNVAAVAAGDPNVTAAAATLDQAAPTESRATRMDSMLSRQQRIVGRLVEAYEKDVEKTLADEAKVSRTQIYQLTTLGNNLMSMERKAWCVPDKIETKDTTPTPVDPIRNLKDDELTKKLEAAREQRVAAERRAGTQTHRGGAPAQSVN